MLRHSLNKRVPLLKLDMFFCLCSSDFQVIPRWWSFSDGPAALHRFFEALRGGSPKKVAADCLDKQKTIEFDSHWKSPSIGDHVPLFFEMWPTCIQVAAKSKKPPGGSLLAPRGGKVLQLGAHYSSGRLARSFHQESIIVQLVGWLASKMSIFEIWNLKFLGILEPTNLVHQHLHPLKCSKFGP